MDGTGHCPYIFSNQFSHPQTNLSVSSPSQESLPSFSFVLFACVCLVACVYTFFFVPETKGKTLLEISEQFQSITVCGKSFSQDQTLETMETQL